MGKYRKKPVVIEAKQFPGITLNTLAEMEKFERWFLKRGGKGRYIDDKLVVPTLEGEMTAAPGDWIICGVKGELYPCKPDIFEATYEPVERAALERKPE